MRDVRMPAPAVLGFTAGVCAMAWMLLRLSAAGSTAKALTLLLLIPASLAAVLNVYAGLLILIVVASTDAFMKAWLEQSWPSLVMKDYFLFLCLVGWLSGRPWQHRDSGVHHRLFVPVAAFGLWVSLEIFNWHAHSLAASLAGARAWLIWIPLFFIAYDSVRSPRALAWLAAWVMGVGALVGAYGLIQFKYGAQGLMNISPGFWYALWKYKWYRATAPPVSRAFSTLSHPNELGIFMSVTMLLAAGALFYTRSLGAKLACAVVGVAAIAGMIASGTRSGFIITTFGLLVMLAATRRLRLAVSVSAVLALAVFTTVAITGPVTLERVTIIWRDLEYTLHRPYSPWYWAVRRAPDYPLGQGLDSGQGVPSRLLQRLPMQGHFYENQYAQALADMGIVGLGLYIWMLYAALRTAYRPVRQLEGQRSYYLALGVFSVTAAMCLSLLVKANLYTAPNGLLFWIMLGASARVGAMMQTATEREQAERGAAGGELPRAASGG